MNAQLDPPVGREICGQAQLEPASMEIHLGTSWRIWTKLLSIRKKNGDVMFTRKWLAEELSMSEHSVRRALTKLRNVGLLQDGPIKRGRKRICFGARIQLTSGQKILVPEHCVKGIGALQSRKRDASEQQVSGPPISSAPESQRTQRKQPTDAVRASGLTKPSPEKFAKKPSGIPISTNGTPPTLAVHPEPLSVHPYNTYVVSKDLSLPLWGSDGAGAREIFPSDFAKHMLSKTRGLPQVIEPDDTPLLPPYPGLTEVPAPVVPDPPKLDPSLSDALLATKLAIAYRGAVESRTGKACWVLARGDITKSKLYKPLVAAAKKMIEHGIAPQAWAAWSIDVWRKYSKNLVKVPPIGMVFSAKRVQEKRGWFRSEMMEYVGRQVIFSKTHKKFLMTYEDMRIALHQRFPENEQQVREIVREFFPNGEYDKTVETIIAETNVTQASLRKKVEAGRWIW